jgi:hypothetical protein
VDIDPNGVDVNGGGKEYGAAVFAFSFPFDFAPEVETEAADAGMDAADLAFTAPGALLLLMLALPFLLLSVLACSR